MTLLLIGTCMHTYEGDETGYHIAHKPSWLSDLKYTLPSRTMVDLNEGTFFIWGENVLCNYGRFTKGILLTLDICFSFHSPSNTIVSYQKP